MKNTTVSVHRLQCNGKLFIVTETLKADQEKLNT